MISSKIPLDKPEKVCYNIYRKSKERILLKMLGVLLAYLFAMMALNEEEREDNE